MDKVIFLFLRRMRAPLLVLIAAYTIAVLGLVLIPGVDAEGRPWHMSFFHAFYIVSYTATTIGFGEVPYTFTDAQRMWTIVSIYLSVIAWLYAIGKILTLLQEPAFKRAVIEQAFARSIRRLREPFYVVCGYGDTGSLLVRALAQRHIRAVVIDRNPDRIDDLELEDLGMYVPGLCADASLSAYLTLAGLLSRHCRGVVALTDDDEANLKIAITSKLLHRELPVICRAETRDVQDNMASFGTDHIINPFDTFGDRLGLALHSPGTHLLYEWLTSVPHMPLSEPLYPPHGKWVLCGYGRFGKAVYESLVGEGVEAVIVEADPQRTGCADRCIIGRGTEAITLQAAGIEEAVGIVAGTDNDANNLSIVMTAAELNPKLFMVARQNRHDNDAIFKAARLNLVMHRSEIIAKDILAQLTTPLLPVFLQQARQQNNAWANEVISRISAVTGEVVPEVWTLTLDTREAPALWRMLARHDVHLGEILRDPRDREQPLPCIPLLLLRGNDPRLMPGEDVVLRSGDRLLFCGRSGVAERMSRVVYNGNVLRYVLSGEERPDGWIWRVMKSGE
ncbi:MAG: hypothetical protein Kow0096_03220 [Thiohalomonadaceae bacterium]